MPLDNSKYTILLILSSLDKPGELERILLEAGFKICKAENLHTAFQMAENNPPDLILLGMDKSVQEETGNFRNFKNPKTICPIPLLFITTVANANYISEYLSLDHIDFILKPFPAMELIIRIQHQLLWLKARRIIRKQNEKLRTTLEARDKLYSVIAHDLRAPIGTIKMINSSVNCQKERIKDPKILKFFEMISETTEEAFNLLENLLHWTRTQKGKTKIYTTHFNITHTIRQVCSLFFTIAATKDIILHNLVTGNHEVCADEDMVKTVLRNLISNAIKFTYPGGKIEVEVTEMPDHLLISVKDNGKGISRTMQSHLLKYNEYMTTYGTRNEKGSGLGLILSRDFVRMNKGKLWFQSQEGVGTTFYFTLPKPIGEFPREDNR